MISRACYVTCDECGDPGPISCWDANDARDAASVQGFRRVEVGGKVKDICPRHPEIGRVEGLDGTP